MSESKLEGMEVVARELHNILGKHCNLPETSMKLYMVNSVLSLIEEREQQLIQAMRYDDFSRIAKTEATRRVLEDVERLYAACLERDLPPEERRKIEQALYSHKIIDEALCYLNLRGLDGKTPLVLIKEVGKVDDIESCLKRISSLQEVWTRSRFIEIAHYLWRLKQRFPDKSIIDSKELVSRVFGYAERRYLPIGVNSDEFRSEIINMVERLYTLMCEKLGGDSDSCKPDHVRLKNLVEKFFERLAEDCGLKSFYRYQMKGIREIISSAQNAILDPRRSDFLTLEAPTGGGKTEAFVISSLLISLAKKLACKSTNSNCKSPSVFVVYPRQALARDQFERLVKYTFILNKVIKDHGFRDLELVISLNYADVIELKKYREKLSVIEPREGCLEETIKGTHVSIPVEVCGGTSGEKYIKFTKKFSFFKCPNNPETYPELYIENDSGVLRCLDERLGFIKITKDDVENNPGDIHVTLFETLRLNLVAKRWSHLFGFHSAHGTTDDFGGPLLIVLDEIHTYLGISGARYAYTLRRVLARIRAVQEEKKSKVSHGVVVLGLSATIPNEDFVANLFNTSIQKVKRIKPSDSETVPLGADYFYVIVPNMKEMIDPLSVSIQALMVLHLNTPSMDPIRKKTFAFADSLDIVSRLQHDFKDAMDKKLPDLRNPFKPEFDVTLRDYKNGCINLGQGGELESLFKNPSSFVCWSDGELWWPYAIELPQGYKDLHVIRKYTSKERNELDSPGIVFTTSALEVGVNYDNVVAIYQHGSPLSITSLVQRAGRAGRRAYSNPLLRTSISVQLSPDIPYQSHLLEIFTRVGSLRQVLKEGGYERLTVATDNVELKKQVFVESLLDYYVFKGMPTAFSSAREFECDMLPKMLSEDEEEIIKYLSPVFSNQDVSLMLEDLGNELERKCRGD